MCWQEEKPTSVAKWKFSTATEKGSCLLYFLQVSRFHANSLFSTLCRQFCGWVTQASATDWRLHTALTASHHATKIHVANSNWTKTIDPDQIGTGNSLWPFLLFDSPVSFSIAQQLSNNLFSYLATAECQNICKTISLSLVSHFTKSVVIDASSATLVARQIDWKSINSITCFLLYKGEGTVCLSLSLSWP